MAVPRLAATLLAVSLTLLSPAYAIERAPGASDADRIADFLLRVDAGGRSFVLDAAVAQSADERILRETVKAWTSQAQPRRVANLAAVVIARSSGEGRLVLALAPMRTGNKRIKTSGDAVAVGDFLEDAATKAEELLQIPELKREVDSAATSYDQAGAVERARNFSGRGMGGNIFEQRQTQTFGPGGAPSRSDGGAFGNTGTLSGSGTGGVSANAAHPPGTARPSGSGNSAVITPPVVERHSLGQSPLSGGRMRLDNGGGPPLTTTSRPGAAGETVPVAEPMSPAALACVSVVNGGDLAKPEHPSLAGKCREYPKLMPMLAGLLDAVKEQFGTVSGILMNLLFLILGLLMAVATGGVALLLKLLALIGAGAAIFMLVRSLISASSAYASAEDGSTEKAAALRTMGLIGGNIMIMLTMALVGFGVGKTQPGAAAIKSMEGGMSAALNKIGGAGLMESLNSRIPAPLVATLEKVFGKAPEKMTADPKAKPVDAARPRELLPEVLENPRLAAVAGKAGTIARVTAAIKSEVRAQVARDMEAILREALGSRPDAGKITGRQFNILLKRLTSYAEQVEGGGITLQKRWGLKGVYPRGPDRIDYKGFGLIANEAAEVSGAQLHELTHLFHTVQMRATVMASGVSKSEGAKFLALMEDGVNYMNLEYYATNVGKPVSGGTAGARFKGIVTSLIESIENSMASGKVELPLGVPIEKGYAYWASKLVPALLGKSPAELALVRLPIGVFVGYYAANTNIGFVLDGASIDPKKLAALGVPPGQTGLRDVLNSAIVAQMSGEQKVTTMAQLNSGQHGL